MSIGTAASILLIDELKDKKKDKIIAKNRVANDILQGKRTVVGVDTASTSVVLSTDKNHHHAFRKNECYNVLNSESDEWESANNRVFCFVKNFLKHLGTHLIWLYIIT